MLHNLKEEYIFPGGKFLFYLLGGNVIMNLSFNANLAAKAGAKRAPLAKQNNQQAKAKLAAQQPAFQGGNKIGNNLNKLA